MTFLENPEILDDYDPKSIPDYYSDSEEDEIILPFSTRDELEFTDDEKEDDNTNEKFVSHPVLQMPKQNIQAKTIFELLNSPNGIPKGWEILFDENWKNLKNLSKNIEKRGAFYPRIYDVFRAFHLLPTKKVKHPRTRQLVEVPDIRCVILGLDPYRTSVDGEPTAVGLSFSVRKGHRLNPSIQNIYKRMIETKVLDHEPDTGDLTNLTAEGVFLLNSALTTPAPSSAKTKNPAGEHVEIWGQFLKKIIEFICKYNPYCVFFLWGAKAKIIETSIKNTCLVLTCSHPAATSRGAKSKEEFEKMDHFNECNRFILGLQKLKKPIYLSTVNWNRINKKEKPVPRKKLEPVVT